MMDYAKAAKAHRVPELGRSHEFIGEIVGGGNSAEQIADAVMVQMFDMRNAPSNIKEQIIAFQRELKRILVYFIKEAMNSERLRIGAAAQTSGYDELAKAMRRQVLETISMEN